MDSSFSTMIDIFLENGFNYFDTDRLYMTGRSETAIRECLVKHYPRNEYILTDKLTATFNSQEDIRPFFKGQLDACGVGYFDFYLMHAQSADIFAKFKKCRVPMKLPWRLKKRVDFVILVFCFMIRRWCWSKFYLNIPKLKWCKFNLIMRIMRIRQWKAKML